MGKKYLPGHAPKDRRLKDKVEVVNLSLQAIEDKYGGLKEGFVALLESNEPSLVRWVFEHAFGKPKEKIDIDINKTVENVQIIQIPHNNRDMLQSETIPYEMTQEIAKETIQTIHGED